jgi:hypothetical protein
MQGIQQIYKSVKLEHLSGFMIFSLSHRFGANVKPRPRLRRKIFVLTGISSQPPGG